MANSSKANWGIASFDVQNGKTKPLPVKPAVKRPPTNALRVQAWRDLPSDAAPGLYRRANEIGNTRTITLAEGNRTIRRALIKQHVYSASSVRGSDRVCILIHDYGFPIKKEIYAHDAVTGRAKFGVYLLGQGVERVVTSGGAA